MKFCKDCKYYNQQDEKYSPTCARPKKPKYDMVTGEDLTVQYFCSSERIGDWFNNLILGYCGNTARYFEEK